MKNFKSLLPFLLMVFALVGCDTDDLRNDVDELKNRVESLEAQVTAINENMNVLQVLVEGNKTIKSCTYDEATKTYKLVLSDDTELELYQGEDGQANTPAITISDDNKWVINGVSTNVNATGADAALPKFKLDNENYWMVDLDGDGTLYDYDYVLNEAGKKVQAKAVDGTTSSNSFFESVKYNEAEGFLEVKLTGDEETYKLPVVPTLTCKINTENVDEYKNGILTVGYGLFATLEVEVQGDNYFVTAPAGWTAVLGEVDPDSHKATLTVYAPKEETTSTQGRAATADNSTDLSLQVNKGGYWAVSKIQVKAVTIISSYYALYQEGETFTIGGIEINKEKFPNVKYISGNATMDSDDVLYFVSPDAVLSYTGTPSFNVSNVLIIGDNPSKKSHFAISNGFIKFKEATGKSLFLCHNLEVNTQDNTNNYSVTSYGHINDVIFDNCYFKLRADKPFYFNGDATDVTRDIENLTISNSILDFSSVTTTSAFFGADKELAYTFNVTLKNNIFYASKDYIAKLFSFKYSTVSLTLQNNTFYKVTSSTSAYVYAKTLSALTVDHNIFYSTTFTGNNVVARSSGSGFDLTSIQCSFSKNVGVKGEYGDSKPSSWQMLYGGVEVDGCEEIENLEVGATPFSSVNEDKMEFVPKPEYADYGAKLD